jgi:UDP-2,4-diacetamido-2,4,6-trideoxy-beta-L-altropyranose hydrolase
VKSGLKKVLFRLDSGTHFGLGHIMRSKALADAFLVIESPNTKIESTFAVKTIHADNAVNPHQLIFISSEEDFISLAGSYDIIIIDHYDYTSELFLRLSQLNNSILVVLDDECNRGKLYADVIVNSAINPSNKVIPLAYKKAAAKAKLLLGAEYILLGQLFNQVELLPFEQRESIIITFGGSDVSGLTLPVLKALVKSSLINFHIIVVTGAGCKYLAEIKKYCLKYSFIYQHNVKNMAALFSTAKFAISAAGSTVFELACCGVPGVFAVVADNQLMLASEQSKLGCCSMIDCRDENKADDLVFTAEKMINELSLKKMSNIAHSQVDGQGAMRVAKKILSL